MGFLNAIDRMDGDQQAGRNWIINAQHHHRITANNATPHLHRCDVDVVFTKHGAQLADDPWHVPMPGQQHVSTRRHVDREFINGGDAQIAIGKHRTRHAVTALVTTSRQLQGPPGKIFTCLVLDLQDTNATALGF